MKKATPCLEIFRKEDAQRILPGVSTQDNKSSRGRSLLFAGSADFPGAGILAARGALRAGSGYVTLAQENSALLSLENPDFLLLNLTRKRWVDSKFDAVLVGPGFGVNDRTEKILRDLIAQKQTHVILDADALTVCAQTRLFPLPPTWIVTPHTGELSRCLNISVEKIQQDRVAAVLAARQLFGCVVLLKGHGTLVCGGDRVFKIASGTAALAKSGTGDVLAGVITAFRAQGMDPISATLLGAYVHGATANLWQAKKRDALSMMASDVIELLPQVFYRLRLSL